MTYRYRLDKSAQRYLRKMTTDNSRRVLELLVLICEDPFDPSISSVLHGRMKELRRARVGDYRIVFRVVDEELLVFVTAIGPRGDVYRG